MTWSRIFQDNPAFPVALTEGMRDQIKRAITRDLGGHPLPSYLKNLLRDADQKGGTSDQQWHAAQGQLNFAAPFQVWGYYQTMISDDPRQMREERTREARKLLKSRGWLDDRGLLKGEGMYKWLDGTSLLYVTDWEGEAPKLGEDLLLGRFKSYPDGELVEMGGDQADVGWVDFLSRQ